MSILRLLKDDLIQFNPPSVEESKMYGIPKPEMQRFTLKYQAKQHQMDALGLSRLVLDLIAKSPSDEIINSSVELAIELLKGGNDVVQRSMYAYLVDNKRIDFFSKIRRPSRRNCVWPNQWPKDARAFNLISRLSTSSWTPSFLA